MALYVDTAMFEEAKEALALGVVSGITTNPTLIRRTGHDEHEVFTTLASLEPRQLFIQLSGSTLEELTKHMEDIRTACSTASVVFKIPPTWPAMALCAKWHDQVDFLVTGVNTVEQAYVAEASGAKYIAVYLHRFRLRNGSWPPIEDIKALARTRLRIMVASCHDLAEVRWALVSGFDDITLPLATIQALLVNKDSEEDIARFDKDNLRMPRD
jgi:transaldolase